MTIYRIVRVPDQHALYDQLKAQVLLHDTEDYRDFIHPLRWKPEYHGSCERLIHQDVHDVYPDAVEEVQV